MSQTAQTQATQAAKVALVTGSSSGIGQACAARLAAAGWRVYGGARSGDVGAGAGWEQLTLDIREQPSVDAAIAAVLARSGQLDALVHCAGISVTGAVEDVSMEEAKAQFETNYFGALRMIGAVLPAMRQAGRGRIIIIGSIGGLIGLPFLSQYSASKFALDGLVEALRLEIAPFGIQATILHPGDVKTAIVANETKSVRTGPASPYHAAFEKVSAVYRKNVENGPAPDSIAKAVEGLLEQSHMPVRKLVGSTTEKLGVSLKSRLPSRWFEAIMRSTYGL